MLPLTAHGAEAELFGGVYDNTDIPKRIAEAMGVDL
jgi:alkaline phosphatase